MLSSCDSPFFTPSERDSVTNLVFWGMLASFAASAFAVLTFLIGGSWRRRRRKKNKPEDGGGGGGGSSVNHYSNRVIFYMNACFVVIIGAGVMAQFISGREAVTCRTDGTRRVDEPGSGENFHCVMVFVLVYYFAIACCVWAVVLVYTWSLIFHRLGRVSLRVSDRRAHTRLYFASRFVLI